MFKIEIEQEADGRWLAEITALPGVMAYGKDARDAQRKVEALALHVLAERLEQGERLPQGAYEMVAKLFAAA
ncbi:MAG TPA: type II toxin-antitoxin system HicB family antitoxin [Gammaproteobacteria bacterium]|nr:type II toxin-antitoxin system HicB family antitoxin [Gammaproteobacteria bacterium]